MIDKKFENHKNCPMCGYNKFKIVIKKKFREIMWSLCKCYRCGLHFTEPCPSQKFLEKFYSDNYHSILFKKNNTEKTFGEKYERYTEIVSPYIKPEGRILDIGCSTGLLVKMLRNKGFRAEGLEINRNTAEWGNKHYNIRIHNKPIEQCSFKKKSFDAMILADVLEHTLHPINYLTYIRELIVSNGIVLVTFPDVTSIESNYFLLMAKLSRRSWVWKNCHIPLHVWEFSKKTAKLCFEKAGFKVISFRRSQPDEDSQVSIILKMIQFPSVILRWQYIGNRFGTQMEFLIRKVNT